MTDSSKTPQSSFTSLDRPKTARSLRFKVPTLPLSTRNDQRKEEIALIKKLYYNPFNELVCYQEFKQYEDSREKFVNMNQQVNQQSQPQRGDSVQEVLPQSLLIQNFGTLGFTSPEIPQSKSQFLTDRNNRQESLILNCQPIERLNSNKEQYDGRKSSLMIDNFRSFNEARQASQNFQAISAILPTSNEGHLKIQNQNKANFENMRRHSSNNMINNFIEEKQTPRVKINENGKNQKQTFRMNKPKMLSQVDPIPIKEQFNQEYLEQVKRKATQETQSYKEIKDLNKILKKQRCQTTRFLNRTKKKQETIQQNLKQGVVDEMDTKMAQEKQTLRYIIKEQLNPQKNPQEAQKMLSETLRSKQIKNFMEKLKLEKATQVATKIITKIKNFSGKTFLRNKYFSELEKDPGSLAQPLAVLVEYADPGKNVDTPNQSEKLSPKDAKKYFQKRKQQQLSLKDNLKVDFFKHIDPQELGRNKADTFYEIRSKAMSMSFQQQMNKSGGSMKKLKLSLMGNLAQLIEDLSPKNSSSQKRSSFNKQHSQNDSQDIAAQPTANTERQHYFDDLIREKNVSYEINGFNETIQQDQIIEKQEAPKRKPLLNGGIEYEYINELGFKVRVQKPPKKKEYKEVTIQKIQKSEDIFFNKFLKKANKIANEVEVRNRITDFTHKSQMKGYHK